MFRSLKLTRQVADIKNVEDISYTHSGYAPMSIRLIEQLILKQGIYPYKEVTQYNLVIRTLTRLLRVPTLGINAIILLLEELIRYSL